MPADLGVYGRTKSFADYQDVAKKNNLAEALTMAQIQKAAQPDYDRMAQDAFIQAATVGPQSLNPTQKALLIQADAKQQTWGINPISGRMEQKPSMLDRAGIKLDGVVPSNIQSSPLPQGSGKDTSSATVTGLFDPSGASLTTNFAPTMRGISPKTQQKAEELTIEAESKRKDAYTKAQGSLVDFGNKAKTVTDNIDSAIGLIDKPYNAATGYARLAGGLGVAPNSDSRLLDNYLTTIKANLGFDNLQSMRDNSPTGGALGQVSDFENKLLQAVNGAMDPYARGQLKANLETIRELYPQVLQERARAFQQDYGNILPASGNPIPMPNLPYISVKNPIKRPDKAAFEAKKSGVTPRIKNDSDYNNLPSGSRYIAPDGTERTKR